MITVSVSEARENLSDLLGKVQHGREDVTIQRHGKPVAVMISVEAYAFLDRMDEEWLEKLVAERLADPDYDPNDTISHEELWAELHADRAAE